MTRQSTVLEVDSLHWATSEPMIVKTLLDRPACPPSRPSAVSRPRRSPTTQGKISVAQLVGWVNDCGYYCTGQSAPGRMCHPMAGSPTAVPSGTKDD